MKREQRIRLIKSFSFTKCPNRYLKYTNNNKWDEKEMLKLPTLSLHDLLRDLRNAKI